MIALLSSEQLTLPEDTEAAIRIAATAEVYGDRPFWRLYRGDGGSVCAVTGDTAVLYPGDDREDMCLFLGMSPDILTVRTDAETARLLQTQGFSRVQTGVVMRRAGAPSAAPEAAEPLSPAEAYPLLQSVFGARVPPWDIWYADVFYRLRRGRCRLVGIRREGEVVSVAMTVAETSQNILIGGVATREDCRRQGLAAACVTALCRETENGNRPVWLAPDHAAGRRLYDKLGFVPCGTWGEAART